MITHSLGKSEINSIPEWRFFFCLTNAKVYAYNNLYEQILFIQIAKLKKFSTLTELTLSINSEHKSAYKSHDSSSLPSLWKLATLIIFDHATWQHPRENPRHLRGAARIYDVRMAHFVLKIEKLSHIMGQLTVSVPDYGSWYYTIIWFYQLLETSASESLYGGQFTLSIQSIKPNYFITNVGFDKV